MHENGHPSHATPETSARRAWTKPTLTRMTATRAELNVGVVDDGVDFS